LYFSCNLFGSKKAPAAFSRGAERSKGLFTIHPPKFYFMSRIRIIAALLLCALIMSCHKKKAVTDTPAGVPVTDAKAVKTDASVNISETGMPYKLDSLTVNGDVLSAWVSYSGGCKEHSFELISNGMYAKSLPPKLSLCLRHSSDTDMCKKLVMQELKFDLSSVRYKGANSMTVKVGDKSVNYNY
jgi:hypothetical protein